jgi:hypothetical protein
MGLVILYACARAGVSHTPGRSSFSEDWASFAGATRYGLSLHAGSLRTFRGREAPRLRTRFYQDLACPELQKVLTRRVVGVWSKADWNKPLTANPQRHLSFQALQPGT